MHVRTVADLIERNAACYPDTRDLARQDDEGNVFIVDRRKDMILSGGENT